MRTIIFLLCLCLLLLSGCATTEVLNVWHEKDLPESKLTNVLVIGVIKEPVYRRIFENSMVEQLNRLGVKASASYSLFPNADYLEKSVIVSKINQLKIDGVIVAKIVDKKKEKVHTAGSTYVSGSSFRGYPYTTSYERSSSWYGYYDSSYQVTRTPGYTVEYDVSTVETNIFSAENEKLVWSAMTETAETNVVNAIKSYVDEIAKQMAESRLFP